MRDRRGSSRQHFVQEREREREREREKKERKNENEKKRVERSLPPPLSEKWRKKGRAIPPAIVVGNMQ